MAQTGTPPQGGTPPGGSTPGSGTGTQGGAGQGTQGGAGQGTQVGAGTAGTTMPGTLPAPPPPPPPAQSTLQQVTAQLPTTPFLQRGGQTLKVTTPGGTQSVIKVPKMGGIEQTDDSEKTPGTGGKPATVDWDDGLDLKPKVIEPTMFRPPKAGSAQKSQVYRTTGLDDKFAKGSSLLKFSKTVWDHLRKYGMDTR